MPYHVTPLLGVALVTEIINFDMVLYQESIDDCWIFGYEWFDSGLLFSNFLHSTSWKFSLTREIRSNRVFPVGSQGNSTVRSCCCPTRPGIGFISHGKSLNLGLVFVGCVTIVFCEFYGIIPVNSRSVAVNSFICHITNFFTKLNLHSTWPLAGHWYHLYVFHLTGVNANVEGVYFGAISWSEGLERSMCQVRYVIGAAGCEDWL